VVRGLLLPSPFSLLHSVVRGGLAISDQDDVLLPLEGVVQDVQGAEVSVSQTVVGKVVADTARLDQSYVASVICERAELAQSAAASVEADSAVLTQSAAGAVAAKEARLEDSRAVVVMAEKVSGERIYCGVLSAEHVEGTVSCLVDQWWIAAVGGATLGIAFALAEWLLRKRES